MFRAPTEARSNKASGSYTTPRLICQHRYFQVYSSPLIRPMGESVSRLYCNCLYRFCMNQDTAEDATPAIAQAKEPLAQANLESVGSTNHRRGTQLARHSPISQICPVSRRAASRISIRLYGYREFPIIDKRGGNGSKTNTFECRASRDGRKDGRFRRMGNAGELRVPDR